MAIDLKDLLPSLLAFAADKGTKGLTTTALVKYLYLLDVYGAESTDGKFRATSIEWRFLKFGPHSFAIAEELEGLAAAGKVQVSSSALMDVDGIVRTYSLSPDYSNVIPLRDLGIPGYVTLKLGSDLARYRNNLPALLDHVYFGTSPMEGVKERQVLDFSSCRKLDFKSYKHSPKKDFSKERLSAIDNVIERIKNKRKAALKPVEPRYDQVYFQGMVDFPVIAEGGEASGKLYIKDDS